MKEKRLIIFDFFGVLGGELSPKWFSNHFGDNSPPSTPKKSNIINLFSFIITPQLRS